MFLFSLFKKTPPFTDIEKTIPRRELIQKSIEILDTLEFKIEENYSEILPRNHLCIIQNINNDILNAGKALKVLKLLKQSGINIRLWKTEIKDPYLCIYYKYEADKFFVRFPWDHPTYISPIRAVERFIKECKHGIELANKSKSLLDQQIDLTKEEAEFLGVLS
ncbi:MAG: hypothetical protein M0R80_03555 [Proteobacteria bacterium]|jgi:hypothetical protein|nr:hypothetical protein [Pseudomonadota bacterium]